MIAQVVPIIRLRRDTTWWAYTIPSHQPCAVGSLVIIPFRGRPCLGIIWALEKEHPDARLEITEILTATPLLKLPHRQLVEFLSDYGLCSLSTALSLWMPKGLRLLPLTKKARTLLQAYTASVPGNPQHCIMVPGLRPQFASRLRDKFSSNFQEFFDETASESLEDWFNIANGHISVGLGRARALFAPWNNLSKITVLDPEDVSYYQEQIPYIDLLEVALSYAVLSKSTIRVQTNLPKEAADLLWPNVSQADANYPSFIFHDLRRESLLNADLIVAINDTLKKKGRIIILHNAHDRIFTTKKNGPIEKILIPGIETLKKKLAQELEVTALPENIIFGSRTILYQKYENVGLAIVLSLDPLIASSNNFSNLLHGVADLGKLASYAVPVIFQSKNADNPLAISLIQGEIGTYLQGEITQQKEAGLTPFGQTIVVSLEVGKLEVEKIEVIHSSICELSNAEWTVSSPFQATWRKREFTHILLHSNNQKNHLPIKLRTFLVKLPRPWKVQRNPWYLL